MSNTLSIVRGLAALGQVRASRHAYRELSTDGLLYEECLAGLDRAIVVEDYPDYFKGPSVLVLQQDATGRPVTSSGECRKIRRPRPSS